MFDMGVDRIARDEQVVANVGKISTFADKFQHLGLALGQAIAFAHQQAALFVGELALNFLLASISERSDSPRIAKGYRQRQKGHESGNQYR